MPKPRMYRDVPSVMTSVLTLKRSAVTTVAALKIEDDQTTHSVKPAAVQVMRNFFERGLHRF